MIKSLEVFEIIDVVFVNPKKKQQLNWAYAMNFKVEEVITTPVLK